MGGGRYRVELVEGGESWPKHHGHTKKKKRKTMVSQKACYIFLLYEETILKVEESNWDSSSWYYNMQLTKEVLLS